MLDYHVHLWPHEEKANERELHLERLALYCEQASRRGVSEIALTEHFFRFRQGREVVDRFWRDEPNPTLREFIAGYFDHHATADLDAYVQAVCDARAAGLPVVAGLEVDYYPGRMDGVAALLDGYPFDVLLGSVHWLGCWMFDVIGEAIEEDEWELRGVAEAWRQYGEALAELAGTGVADVLAHPDLVKVAGRWPDAGVVREVEERIADAAASSGMAAEISSAGLAKPAHEIYPSANLLRLFAAKGVPVTTASDSHGPWEVADGSALLHRTAVRAGYASLRAFRRRVGADVPIGPEPRVVA